MIRTKHSFLLLLWLTFFGYAHTHSATKERQQDDDTTWGGCGFEEPSQEQLIAMQQREQRDDKRDDSSNLFFRFALCRFFPNWRICSPIVNVRVFVHSIENTNGTDRLSDGDINEMLEQAQRRFNGTDFTFSLEQVNRRINDDWYNAVAGSDEEIAMMRALQKPGFNNLNVYLKRAVLLNRGDYCGYANLAEKASSSRDAVIVRPKCALDNKTLAHEIGHWLNLLHTFTGGCQPPGDLVSDTPYQSVPLSRIGGACPAPYPDSCPDHPGRDPIDNMMDYSPVNCPDEFTTGQIERMHQAWRRYRRWGRLGYFQ